jgi:hypothetical protein
MAEAVGEADGLARVLRLTALVALVSCLIVVVAALLLFGLRAAALAAAGSAVGLLNLWVAAGALRKVPVLFIGTSVPRLALVTGVILVLVLALGPIAVWALVGLLVTQVAEVGMMLRHGLHEMRS